VIRSRARSSMRTTVIELSIQYAGAGRVRKEGIGAMARLLKMNFYKPTIAREVPAKLTLGRVGFPSLPQMVSQILPFASRMAARLQTFRKLAYIRLNSQTPCPPSRLGGTVPVNQGYCGFFHSQYPSWVSARVPLTVARSGFSLSNTQRGG
jgi:hypothetical protein